MLTTLLLTQSIYSAYLLAGMPHEWNLLLQKQIVPNSESVNGISSVINHFWKKIFFFSIFNIIKKLSQAISSNYTCYYFLFTPYPWFEDQPNSFRTFESYRNLWDSILVKWVPLSWPTTDHLCSATQIIFIYLCIKMLSFIVPTTFNRSHYIFGLWWKIAIFYFMRFASLKILLN